MKKAVHLFLKRAFDILASLCGILLLTAIPVLIVVPVLIRLTSAGPAFFLQDRVGKGGKVFKVIKFRTMRIPQERFDKDGNALNPSQSVTGVGRFLRKTSLDELPQLFNILKGDMSVVGPRPMLPSMVANITAEENTRHDMRPGVTGLAQAKGRNNLTWAEKLRYDTDYVRTFSIGLDIAILLQTVRVVLRNEGIEYVHLMKDERSTASAQPAPDKSKGPASAP